MLCITMNGATMNGAVVTSVGVQRSLLPLHLTLTPRASGLTFSGVLNNSFTPRPSSESALLCNWTAYAHAAGYVALELSTNGREYTSSSSGLMMLALTLCAGPETGGTVLTIGGAFANCQACLPPLPPCTLPPPCAARHAGPLPHESRRCQGET
jgi:hypothetical protein